MENTKDGLLSTNIRRQNCYTNIGKESYQHRNLYISYQYWYG